MKSADIREGFLSYFQELDHYRLDPASLIPDDVTAMFTIAGMMPLKPYFTGERKPIAPRLTSCQRCIRTNDIENVGKTNFHHTLFEMLGNFSIGDYFKSDAIPWALEYLTSKVGIPKDRLVVTVYPDDIESKEIWKKLGFPNEKIVELESNFWMMGDVGPCGPDSEIHFDWDAGKPYPIKNGAVDLDDPRFVELWNIVFTQFDAKEDGTRAPLPKKNIDTGAGLERIAAVSQGVRSSFDSDLFEPIMREVSRFSENGIIQKKRQIADHAKAATFLIGDGVFPANDGRGYVLKRLIRRASLAGKKVGIEKPFLSTIADSVIKAYSPAYPFLSERKEAIVKIINNEEVQFLSTLSVGLELLEGELSNIDKGGKLNGKTAFKLYDTYGFPIDLTGEIAQEMGYSVDFEEFEDELENQRQRGRMSFKGQKEFQKTTALLSFRDKTVCDFDGYENLEVESVITGIHSKQGSLASANIGDEIKIATKTTPFYPEKGGQIGDSGIAVTPASELEIIDTLTPVDGLILHRAKVTKGTVSVGDPIKLSVNKYKRDRITQAHTATHLLHAVLRDAVGEHVKQAGSWVGEDELRFDFSSIGEVSTDALFAVERTVNSIIRANIPLEISEMSIDEAKNIGAMALFGEKYGDIVRVVKIGDKSMELCGGCHVTSTGKIGAFKITSEASIGSGLRRIEALIGDKAIRHFQDTESRLSQISLLLGTGQKGIKEKVESLLDELGEAKKRIKALTSSMAKVEGEQASNRAVRVGATNVMIERFDGFDMDGIRMIADFALDAFDHGVAIILSKNGQKCFLVAISKSIPTSKLHCGKLIGKVGSIVGFKGGGRPDMGQAGGIEPAKASQVLATFETELAGILKEE